MTKNEDVSCPSAPQPISPFRKVVNDPSAATPICDYSLITPSQALPPVGEGNTPEAIATHGVKFDGEKVRWDLLPAYPLSLVAEVFSLGARKYAAHNWRKGIKASRYFAAMMRHAWAWWAGEKFDKDGGQHHLASVAFNALCLMEIEVTNPEMDDRYLENVAVPIDTCVNIHYPK